MSRSRRSTGQECEAHSAHRAADRKVDHVPRRLGSVCLGILRGDVPHDNLTSFNRWIDEDWGFNTQDRIHAPAPAVAGHPDRAVVRSPTALAAGAGSSCCRPGRSTADRQATRTSTRSGRGSTGACGGRLPHHRVPLPGERGPALGLGSVPPFQFSAWQWQNTYGERPITDTLSALIFDNLFGRYPNIRVLVGSTVPSGCRTSSVTWTRVAAWRATGSGWAVSWRSVRARSLRST